MGQHKNPLAIAPRPAPHAGDWPMYLTGRTQYPISEMPMQTAMNRQIWAGSELGQWTPLQGYGANYPAAPQLSQMQQAEYLVTQPMQNGEGYQMVAMRDNGVPLGGTPATTPHYVTAGPIQPTALGFVQPIMRQEQTPLAGQPRRPTFNPDCPPNTEACGHYGGCPPNCPAKVRCCPSGDIASAPTPTTAPGAMPVRGRIGRSAIRGRRPMFNPSTPSGFIELPIDPDSGPFEWNNRQGATVGPMGGGPEAWPFVTPPAGYMMAGTDAGGWPVFALDPVAPPDLPVQVPKELVRAATNPALPAALGGIPLIATALGAAAVAGGVTAYRGRDPKEEEVTLRRASVRRGATIRGMKPVRVTKTSTVKPLQGVKIMQATVQPNPVIWPWVLGAAGALGAGAYGAWRCSPGQRLFSTDSMPGASVTRSLDFQGCFQEHPWRATKLTQVSAPGVAPIEEKRSFGSKRDAMAWLYTGEEPTALDGGPDPVVGDAPATSEDNPRPPRLGRGRRHGMASRFRAKADACRPRRTKAEHHMAVGVAEKFWNLHHALPNAEQLNALVNHAYSETYPEAPYPIPSATHPCAKTWLAIRGLVVARLKAFVTAGQDQAAPRWWMRGASMQRMDNPIPGAVTYNGYFHGDSGIPGSSGYGGHAQNPSVENAMAAQLYAAGQDNIAAQQYKLLAAENTVRVARLGNPAPVVRMMGMEGRSGEAAQRHQMMGVASTIQEARLGHRQQPVGNPVKPLGARPQWSGFRSSRRLTAARMANPHGEACCSSCAIGAPCAGECKTHAHDHGKGHGACCDSCAVGGPCDGCGVAGGCDCK